MPQHADARDRIAPAVVAWFADAARPLPWRAADVSPWAVLVSEFMLQQTQVGRVLPRWEEWVRRWPTPAALAAEPPAEAVRAWDRLGYPRRALWLHRAATQIVERHGGEVPHDLDALLALQGVGPYTARAIAAFAFGDRHPVVDTNTRRVIARAVSGAAEAGPPATVRDLAAMERLLPEDREEARRFNAGAMELGATVCTRSHAALRRLPDRRPVLVARRRLPRVRRASTEPSGPIRGQRPPGARHGDARAPGGASPRPARRARAAARR
jgi:A/G-specific adenine glycosylase